MFRPFSICIHNIELYAFFLPKFSKVKNWVIKKVQALSAPIDILRQFDPCICRFPDTGLYGRILSKQSVRLWPRGKSARIK